jgi:hypothetical protein
MGDGESSPGAARSSPDTLDLIADKVGQPNLKQRFGNNIGYLLPEQHFRSLALLREPLLKLVLYPRCDTLIEKGEKIDSRISRASAANPVRRSIPGSLIRNVIESPLHAAGK